MYFGFKNIKEIAHNYKDTRDKADNNLNQNIPKLSAYVKKQPCC